MGGEVQDTAQRFPLRDFYKTTAEFSLKEKIVVGSIENQQRWTSKSGCKLARLPGVHPIRAP